MDTKTTSPFASSKRRPTIYSRPQPQRFRGLAMALTLGTGLWLGTVTAGLTQAEASPPKAEAVHRPTEAVTYADLDLSTRVGAHELLKRIDLAAKRACGIEPSHSPLEPRAVAHFRDCVDASVDAAVARVGSSTLTSIHDDIKSTASVTLAAR